MEKIIEIIVTFNDREAAEAIGRVLVERRLAACAQISGPIKSIYWWKGRMEQTEEWICTLKTRKDLYDMIEKEIRALHPYEIPQIIAMDINRALPEYAAWIWKEISKGSV